MQISDEDLQEFMRLYIAEFREELSKAEASEIAGRFADLYMLLAELLPSELEEREGTRQPSGMEETPPASA